MRILTAFEQVAVWREGGAPGQRMIPIPKGMDFKWPRDKPEHYQTLWRGMPFDSVDFYEGSPQDIQMLMDQHNFDHPRVGEALLDYLDAQGQKKGTGLGRHWSTHPEVGATYANYRSDDLGSQVRVRAKWRKDQGKDPDKTDRGGSGFWPGEYERTLLPGTPLDIEGIEVRNAWDDPWKVVPLNELSRRYA